MVMVSLNGECHAKEEEPCQKSQHGCYTKVEASVNHAEHNCLAHHGTESAGEVVEFFP
jgi:hypothetical protein